MLFAVLASFLFALLLFIVGKNYFDKVTWLPIMLPASLLTYFLSFLPLISSGETYKITHEWVPSLGVNFSFYVDGLSLLFSLLITGIGTLVYIYTSYYLKGHEKLLRFYAYLSIFMGAMLGLVLSNNLITLFIFWELTSISSFFLIGFNNTQEASRKSAMVALAITGFGGMTLLGFAVLAGVATGTYEITEMLTSTAAFETGPYAIILLVLLCLTAFTKSAQFPFHFWLPGAMKAPTPVSTYLHSATMVKAGVYLLFRFSPHFQNNDYWSITLITVGGITMLYAAFHTLFRTDLKGILAYSTITALGILVFLIGIGTTYALSAALVFIIVHALYKATLFLITGIIDHQTGTRDITKLGGLAKFMWPVAIAGIIAAVSSAGVPPSIGFVGKDLIYEATLHVSNNATLLTSIAVITNILMVFAGALVGIKPFFGKNKQSQKKIEKPNPILWVPPVILSVGSLLFGLFPSLLGNSLINPSLIGLGVSDISGIKLWHGFNFVLLLSMITIGVGVLIYFIWKQQHQKEKWIKKFELFSPKSIFSVIEIFFEQIGTHYTKTLQNGYLRNYVLVLMLSFTVVLGYHVFTSPLNFIHPQSLLEVEWNDITVVSIMALAILFTVFSRSRLAAIAGLGIVGYAMCFIFVFYSAPDLAMTQFTIDTLTVILFVLVLYRLPRYLNMSNTKMRIRDGIIATSLGVMITLLILEIMNETPLKDTSAFYADNSYVLAKGKNIVNVILVDFRGFDTFVEVIVLAIAAIGVFGLLKLHLKRKEN